MHSQAHRRLNWHPSRKSSLDVFHRPTLTRSGFKLVDMEAACQPIKDQGDEGSCTAFAVTAAWELEERLAGHDLGPASEQALYYWGRRFAGHQAIDSGSTVTDVMRAALTFGLPRETVWPYDMPFDVEPAAAVYADGKARLPSGKMIARVPQGLAYLYTTLAANHPIPCGFTVFTSFMDVGADGIWRGIQKSDQVEGGHAVVMVGYDPIGKRFKFRNSWGLEFGLRGYFFLPQDFVLSANMDDFIAVVAAPAAPLEVAA